MHNIIRQKTKSPFFEGGGAPATRPLFTRRPARYMHICFFGSLGARTRAHARAERSEGDAEHQNGEKGARGARGRGGPSKTAVCLARLLGRAFSFW